MLQMLLPLPDSRLASIALLQTVSGPTRQHERPPLLSLRARAASLETGARARPRARPRIDGPRGSSQITVIRSPAPSNRTIQVTIFINCYLNKYTEK